jgi:hypothetical protein
VQKLSSEIIRQNELINQKENQYVSYYNETQHLIIDLTDRIEKYEENEKGIQNMMKDIISHH